MHVHTIYSLPFIPVDLVLVRKSTSETGRSHKLKPYYFGALVAARKTRIVTGEISRETTSLTVVPQVLLGSANAYRRFFGVRYQLNQFLAVNVPQCGACSGCSVGETLAVAER